MKQSKEITTFLTKYYLLNAFGAMYFIGSFIMIIVNAGIPNAFDITVLLTMFSIVKIVFEIPSGAFADRFGRKNTLVLAELIGGLALVFLLLRRNYFDFAMFYLLLGLWDTLKSGTLEAFIYDNMKKLGIIKDYAKYQARKSIIRRITFALSALFASYLILFGYNIVIIATIISTFIGSLLITLTIEDTNKNDKNIAKLSNNYWKVLKNGFAYSFKHTTILKFIIFIVFSLAFVGVMDNYYELVLFQITNNLQMVPVLVAISAGGSGLIQFAVTKHLQNKKVIFIIGIAVFNAMSSLIAFVFYSFPISFIFLLFSWGSLTIFFQILNAKKQMLIPSKIRATVNSVEGFLLGIAGVVYLLFFGYIVDISSYKTGFIVISSITLLITLVFLYVLGCDKHLRRKEKRL